MLRDGLVSTATATARRAPARRTNVAQQKRRLPRLRVVQRTRALRHRRLGEIVGIAILFVSILSIVIGHALLAQGQLRLGQIDRVVVQERAVHSQTVLKVAALETPARISSEAGALHLVQPSQVLQLPSVPLTQPLPPIKITPAPGA